MKITKRQQILTEKLLEIEKNIEEKIKKQRIEGIASHLSWWEKIIMVFKI